MNRIIAVGLRAAADAIENLDDETPSKPAAKKKPAADDDDETPAPKKRKPAAEDDDDTPAPKKKAKPADDDDEPAPKKKAKPADDDELDYERDIRPQVVALSKDTSREVALEVLEKFTNPATDEPCTKGAEVDPEDWPRLLKEIKKARAKHEADD